MFSSPRAVWKPWKASLRTSRHLHLRNQSTDTKGCLTHTMKVRTITTPVHAGCIIKSQHGFYCMYVCYFLPDGFTIFQSESSLLSEAPPTPALYKYRPSYSSPGKNHTHSTHKVRTCERRELALVHTRAG